MAMHHGRQLADDLAIGDGDDEMMARRAEIVRQRGAVDGMIEHVGRNPLEDVLVARPQIPDLDGHRPWPWRSNTRDMAGIVAGTGLFGKHPAD